MKYLAIFLFFLTNQLFSSENADKPDFVITNIEPNMLSGESKEADIVKEGSKVSEVSCKDSSYFDNKISSFCMAGLYVLLI